MIEERKIKEIIKSHLPYSEDEIVENIAKDVIGDAEVIIYSMIRQTVSQEKLKLFRNNEGVGVGET